MGHERSQKKRGKHSCLESPKNISRERDQIRLGLWEVRLKKPTATLAKALGCLEQIEFDPAATSVCDFESVGPLSLPLSSVGWTSQMILREIPLRRAGACLLTWRTCGGVTARRVPIGTEKSYLGTEGEESKAGTSSDEEYEEHNVANLSLEVVGQDWPGWLVHFFLRIGNLRG